MKTQVFVLLSAIFCTVSSIKLYNGHQVYSVNATNKMFMERLLHMRQNVEVDFWSEPNLSDPTTIMVSDTYKIQFEEYLDQHGIKYIITIQDVQKAIDKTKEISGDKMDWKSYHSLQTIYDWMDTLAANYPHLASVKSIGTSYEERDMRLIHISSGGNSGSKPAIFFDGGIHAREWISPATVTYIINQLVTNYTHNKDIVDAVDWYILPVLNVDGYEYTHNTDRLWRKTRSNNVPSSGCRGADANRNYDFHFDAEGGASSDPCSLNFRGAYPFSEPETKAMSEFLANNKDRIKLYINFHSFGQYWLLPWGYARETPSDIDDLKTLASDAVTSIFLVNNTRYIAGTIPDLLYLASGSASDWAKGVVGIKYAYSVELRDTGEYGFVLPPEHIIPSGEEIFAAVRTLAKRVAKM